MNKVSFFLWLFLLIGTALQAQPSRQVYWQQQANYTIHATLNDTSHSLDGSVHIDYFNHSPDTLRFLWVHLWPNAYKNDRTTFSNQMLLERNTAFYFSKPEEKGYINRINFTANQEPVQSEDHPAYIDVIKLWLPTPLAPGGHLVLYTPFHLQLPYIFSRSGHMKQFYALAQWFPKVAMYDASGWHPMPYLSAGEYYSNFGDYDVSITLPENYAVAATGTLQNESEIAWLKTRTNAPITAVQPKKKELFNTKTIEKFPIPPSSKRYKTLRYKANNVVDFAWAADKRFIVKNDTCMLAGKAIDVWNFILPEDVKNWQNSVSFTKRALQFYSQQLGIYPYPQMTVVASPASKGDGMEYPMLTFLNEQSGDEKMLDIIIAHETGHNWLQATLATNERNNGWMDEGMNTFLEQKYTRQYYPAPGKQKTSKIPEDLSGTMLQWLYERKWDVPIQVAADTVVPAFLYASIYAKAAEWMNRLEAQIGEQAMQQLLRLYFQQWQFKHPQPHNFLALASEVSKQSIDTLQQALQLQGPLQKNQQRKTVVTGLFNLSNTDTKKYIGLAPAFGFNQHDKLMLGVLVHNYNIPATPFQFVATPMLATGSKQPVGYARFSYHWYPKKVYKTTLYSSFAHFNFNEGKNEAGNKLPIAFTKIAPGIAIELKRKNSLSTLHRTMDLKAFFISEQQVNNVSPPPPGDTIFYAVRNGTATTVIPQLTFKWSNTRKLYPWSIEASMQQVKQIIRTGLTAQYFLNYNKTNKGISARFFVGKIFYTTEKNTRIRSENSRYHFTMQGPNGYQDYTYSQAFVERNQSAQLGGRQITMRDGGFKYRSDFSAVVPGLKTNGVDFFDNWLMALNLNVDLPNAINPLSLLPFSNRLQIFADLGTSASPWQAGSTHPKFLYSMGIHLPILKALHIYYPIIQSNSFKEPNSVNDPFRPGGPKWWQQRLTFSIQIQELIPSLEGVRLF